MHCSLRESMHNIAGPMYYFGMTDVEFIALVAVILFDYCKFFFNNNSATTFL